MGKTGAAFVERASQEQNRCKRDGWKESTQHPQCNKRVLWAGPSLAFCLESFVLLLPQNKTTLSSLHRRISPVSLMSVMIYLWDVMVGKILHLISVDKNGWEDLEVLALCVEEHRLLIQYIRITSMPCTSDPTLEIMKRRCQHIKNMGKDILNRDISI